MKKYEYMVNYLFPNGSGRIFVTRTKKIKTSQDILELDEFLREDESIMIDEAFKKQLYVSDFKLLKKYRVKNY